jgi:hypothetical protein
MYIPPGRLDLWLNNRRLVKGLDYYINYPELVIVNKEYLLDGPTQNVSFRAYGFCNPDMSIRGSKQVGFVENGLLSYNGQYDLRDDKVVQITVDGRSLTRNDVKFPEDGWGVGVSSQYEGRPYEVSDVVVPIRGVTDYDTYLLRERSVNLDKRVSDYLTTKFPEHVFPDLPAVLEAYKVYSPFLNKLIRDIVRGVFLIPSTIQTDRQVMTSVQAYRYLLAYDPCVLGVNDTFVVIHPVATWGTITVKSIQYNFLERVIALLLNGKVDLTHFLIIEG